jgi:hypothetical protein
MRRIWGLHHADEAMEVAEYLRALLLEKPLGHIIATGLHDYLDIVQIQIQYLAAAIGRAFFRDWRPALSPWSQEAPADSLSGQSQSQSQGA